MPNVQKLYYLNHFAKCKIRFKHSIRCRSFCTQKQLKELSDENSIYTQLQMPEPEYDMNFICNPINRDMIFENIRRRKGFGDIDKVLELSQKPEQKLHFLNELKKIPNLTDPSILKHGDEPRIVKECGHKPEFNVAPKEFANLAHGLRLMRTESMGPVAGQKGYVFFGELAELEEALVHFCIKKLMKYNFKLVSVPDIIPTEIIKRCGLELTHNNRTLVYKLDPYYGDDLSLSGTAEMSLAAQLMNTKFSFDVLPLKLAAVSRCYRAEVSNIKEQRGIYRVHQFTKVEMFVCSQHEKSMECFQYLQSIQEDIFSSLGLHFRVVDMPPHELGASAYRKVDIEGWMPGRKQFGELSSCSNCTDFQSRRLNIKYTSENNELLHVHTLNGTACAIPRLLIALCETYQTEHSRIKVPECLIPYMKGKTLIRKQPVASMRTYKYKGTIN